MSKIQDLANDMIRDMIDKLDENREESIRSGNPDDGLPTVKDACLSLLDGFDIWTEDHQLTTEEKDQIKVMLERVRDEDKIYDQIRSWFPNDKDMVEEYLGEYLHSSDIYLGTMTDDEIKEDVQIWIDNYN